MKLATLNPQWLDGADGRRGLGLRFDCPCCLNAPANERLRIYVHVDPPLDGGAALAPAWKRSGDTFESLTLSPSIHLQGAHDWHGFVTNGEVTSC